MSGFPELYYAPCYETISDMTYSSFGYRRDYSSYRSEAPLSVPLRIQIGCIPRTTIPCTGTPLPLREDIIPDCESTITSDSDSVSVYKPEPLVDIIPVCESTITSDSGSIYIPINCRLVNLLPSTEFRYRYRYKRPPDRYFHSDHNPEYAHQMRIYA